MDRRNFHQRFLDSLRQRDWQLCVLVAVPVAAFLLSEAVSAMAPERPFPERCAREVRAYVTERMIGALTFDIGRPEVLQSDGGELTVEMDIQANGIPLRSAYLCTPDGSDGLTLHRLWSRRA